MSRPIPRMNHCQTASCRFLQFMIWWWCCQVMVSCVSSSPSSPVTPLWTPRNELANGQDLISDSVGRNWGYLHHFSMHLLVMILMSLLIHNLWHNSTRQFARPWRDGSIAITTHTVVGCDSIHCQLTCWVIPSWCSLTTTDRAKGRVCVRSACKWEGVDLVFSVPSHIIVI